MVPVVRECEITQGEGFQVGEMQEARIERGRPAPVGVGVEGEVG